MDVSNNTECCFSKKKITPLIKQFSSINKASVLLSTGISISLCVSTVVEASSPEFLHKGSSITATVFNFHETSTQQADQYIVKYAKHGIKFTEQLSGISVIQNFKDSVYWVVNDKKAIYQEFLVSDTKNHTIGQNSDSNEKNIINIAPSSLLSSEPCIPYTASFTGYKKWNGLLVSQWQCLNGELIEKYQLYSEYYKLVVQEKMINGWVSELRNIRIVDIGISEYKPDVNYAQVGFEQWFGQGALLKSYRGSSGK